MSVSHSTSLRHDDSVGGTLVVVIGPRNDHRNSRRKSVVTGDMKMFVAGSGPEGISTTDCAVAGNNVLLTLLVGVV